LPQSPQLRTSLVVSAQIVVWAVPIPTLHALSVEPQLAVHEPAEQTRPGPHALPQSPQLAGSTFTSMHEALHAFVPPLQESWQAPWAQTWPPTHIVPHAPQLFGSFIMSVQLTPHAVIGATQFAGVAPSPEAASPSVGVAGTPPASLEHAVTTTAVDAARTTATPNKSVSLMPRPPTKLFPAP
jgi:hypothetical protein